MQIIPYPYKLATRYRGNPKNPTATIIDIINEDIAKHAYGFDSPDSIQKVHIEFDKNEFRILMMTILVGSGEGIDWMSDKTEPLIKFIGDIYIREGYGFEFKINDDGMSLSIDITI